MTTLQKKRQHGFSLLEVMIVIVVMAIGAATIRLMAVSDDPLKDIEKTAHTFNVWFNSQLDQALLSNSEIGLHFTETQIAVLSWREGNPELGETDVIWEVVNDLNYANDSDTLNIELVLDLDLQEWINLEETLPEDTDGIVPHLILFPSEDYFPSFYLTFNHSEYRQERVIVRGDSFNRLEVRREEI
jgi:prepilin-type N-terminal cleavage/methylation domain-containing protein